uniref:GDNF/GAS1 domain-containing protein n=1 Tax=Chrysemys picta bellii TaxID=8478 RepID=A0A8C3ILM7_CHRPI
MPCAILAYIFAFLLFDRSSSCTDASPHTAIRSSVSRLVHAILGGLHGHLCLRWRRKSWGAARSMWLFLPLLLCWGRAGGGAPGEPCWEALLRCQDEPDCGSAYSQSQAACEPVLAGAGGEEPPRRLPQPLHRGAGAAEPQPERPGPGALRVRAGRALPPAEGGHRALPAPALPQRPGLHGRPLPLSAGARLPGAAGRLLGPLRAALQRAALHGRLPGRHGAAAGRAGGPALERCVCDGPERPFCQVLKANMGRLCSGPPAEPGPDEDYRDEERLLREEDEGPGAGGAWVRSGGRSRDAPAWRALALGALPLGLRLLSWP